MVNAGCLFISDKHVLAGYQPNKRMPTISGFGGKGKEKEEPYQTAWRETLEELFGWKTVVPEVLQMAFEMTPLRSDMRNSYVQLTYSFTHLEDLLKKLYVKGCISVLYDVFPSSIAELVLNRKHTVETEVTVLAILPLEGQTVALHFQKDVKGIIYKDTIYEKGYDEGPMFCD